MSISHCGGSGVLKDLVQSICKAVIQRCEARVPEAHQHDAALCVMRQSIQGMRSRTNLWFSAMTCGWWKVPKYVIAHLLRDLWIASSQTPRNDEKRHSEGTARRISFNKRSFDSALDDNVVLLHCVGSLCKDGKVYSNDGKKRFFGFHPQNDIEKKAAFTLAEVLITLGIIGIIAAMTLPSLINTYRKLDTSARLKKFYSGISQAVNFTIVENGEPIGWMETLTYHDSESLYDWFDRYIIKYMRILKNCRNAGSKCIGEYTYCDYPGRCYNASYISRNAVLYIFNDGSMITSLTGGGVDEETGMATSMGLHVRFDTNGYGKPNTYGQDVFSFKLNINEKFAYMTCDAHKNLTGGTVSLKDDRDTLLQACKTDPQTCSCLLMYDGWEFKKDYPWL